MAAVPRLSKVVGDKSYDGEAEGAGRAEVYTIVLCRHEFEPHTRGTEKKKKNQRKIKEDRPRAFRNLIIKRRLRLFRPARVSITIPRPSGTRADDSLSPGPWTAALWLHPRIFHDLTSHASFPANVTVVIVDRELKIKTKGRTICMPLNTTTKRIDLMRHYLHRIIISRPSIITVAESLRQF